MFRLEQTYAMIKMMLKIILTMMPIDAVLPYCLSESYNDTPAKSAINVYMYLLICICVCAIVFLSLYSYLHLCVYFCDDADLCCLAERNCLVESYNDRAAKSAINVHLYFFLYLRLCNCICIFVFVFAFVCVFLR